MRLGSVKTCKPSVSSLAVTLAFRYICPQIYKKYGERCKLLAFISVFTDNATSGHAAAHYNTHRTKQPSNIVPHATQGVPMTFK